MRTELPDWGSDRYWNVAPVVDAELRARGPAHRVVLANGVPVWLIMGYREARSALSDWRTFSHEFDLVEPAIRVALEDAGGSGNTSSLISRTMLFRDPPDQPRLRRLVAAAFRRGKLDEVRMTAITTDLLDQWGPPGSTVDLVQSLAFPLPVTVICEMLGVPAEDQQEFKPWSADMTSDDPDLSVPASKAMAGYLAGLIAHKRERPGDDLLSRLIAASDDDGGQLSEEELLMTAMLVLVAGHETTQNLIGNTVVGLLSSDAWAKLVADPDPELLAAAVVEGGRWDSGVRAAPFRVTTRPVTVGEVTIPAGEIVLVLIHAANRDPQVFARPDEFDPYRVSDDAPLTYGHGIHYCLGAQLAQLETGIVLRQLAMRFPGLRLADNVGELERVPGAIMNGWRQIPVVVP